MENTNNMRSVLGFVLFLLTGWARNPANSLAPLLRGEDPEKDSRGLCPRPWRIMLASALLGRDWLSFPMVARWAAIEALSAGSHQRWTCPVPELRGTGRWGADDGGGHYALLRKTVTEYLDLPDGQVQLWERCAAAFGRQHIDSVVATLVTRAAWDQGEAARLRAASPEETPAPSGERPPFGGVGGIDNELIIRRGPPRT